MRVKMKTQWGNQHTKSGKPADYRKIYLSYRDQLRRCYDERVATFKWYGALGISVEYSFEEFITWWTAQTAQKSYAKPSVGRIDHTKNYTLENIEMVERAANSAERVMRKGTPIPRVPVRATKDGQVVGEFESVRAASVTLGCKESRIHRVLNGKSRIHRGYTFERVEV